MLTGEQSNVEERASRLRVPQGKPGAHPGDGFEIVGCVHAFNIGALTPCDH